MAVCLTGELTAWGKLQDCDAQLLNFAWITGAAKVTINVREDPGKNLEFLLGISGLLPGGKFTGYQVVLINIITRIRVAEIPDPLFYRC